MNRNVPTILVFLFLILMLPLSGGTVTGNDIIELKKSGLSEETIQFIVKEKVIETAAFSVDDIVNMKKAGVTEKTIRMVIKEGAFPENYEPIIYGRKTQPIRQIAVEDIINLKNNGVSDSIIQSVIEATKSVYEKDRERAWHTLENMKLRIYTPTGR